MKNKKNGFTLVELLAVIVILAIILLIAVPNILGVIEKSREDSFESSVKMIVKQAEYDSLSETDSGERTFDLTTLSYDGQRYESGSLQRNLEGEIEAYLWSDEVNKCAYKAYGTDDVVFVTDATEATCTTGPVIVPLDIASTDTCWGWNAGSQTLTSYDIENCSNDVVIPTTVDGVYVLHLGDEMISSNNYWYGSGGRIDSLDLTNAHYVETIGFDAFLGFDFMTQNYYTSIDLTNMTNLTSIGNNAFGNAFDLTSVSINDGVTLSNSSIDSAFKTAYDANGAGTYTGVFDSNWTQN